jgi:hypothetical protein
MLCKKLCCDITIHLVTKKIQSCIPYSVTLCILRSSLIPSHAIWITSVMHACVLIAFGQC